MSFILTGMYPLQIQEYKRHQLLGEQAISFPLGMTGQASYVIYGGIGFEQCTLVNWEDGIHLCMVMRCHIVESIWVMIEIFCWCAMYELEIWLSITYGGIQISALLSLNQES